MGLRKRSAATRDLLGEGIVASYKVGAPNFHVGHEHLNNCANVRDLVKDCTYPIASVTKPQAFRIKTDLVDGQVKTQVQPRSYKDEWGVINSFVLCGWLWSVLRTNRILVVDNVHSRDCGALEKLENK